jgi:hypothetical protein
VQLTTQNGWKAFEVISDGDVVHGLALAHKLDGAGAWLVNANAIRIQVNHEILGGRATISKGYLNRSKLQAAIRNKISTGSTGGLNFAENARQAYDR